MADVARDFIETDADIFWAQLGLQSQEAEQILREAGRDKIVMNRCIKIEYAYSGLGKNEFNPLTIDYYVSLATFYSFF